MDRKHLAILTFTLILSVMPLSFTVAATQSVRLFVPGIT